MMDDLEQMIKERLLQDLIEKMSDQSGDRLKPKGLAVEVAAPDKEHLSDGLDQAKDAVGSIPSQGESPSEEDDEQRLMELLGDDEDEEKDSKFAR